MDILTILILPIQEHGMSDYFLVSSSISFISILQYSEYMCFISLTKFIASYFILFHVILNSIRNFYFLFLIVHFYCIEKLQIPFPMFCVYEAIFYIFMFITFADYYGYNCLCNFLSFNIFCQLKWLFHSLYYIYPLIVVFFFLFYKFLLHVLAFSFPHREDILTFLLVQVQYLMNSQFFLTEKFFLSSSILSDNLNAHSFLMLQVFPLSLL